MYQVSFNVKSVSECPQFKPSKDEQIAKESFWVIEPSRSDLLDGSGFCITGFVALCDLDDFYAALEERDIGLDKVFVLPKLFMPAQKLKKPPEVPTPK